MNRPNFSINESTHTYKYLGENNLRKSFYNCFQIVLSSCYNDGTKGSRFYSKVTDDNRSAYYVEQPELELHLKDFVENPLDKDSFLVGFTGIGKTTLIRNYFKIMEFNPFVDENKNLIAYLSVFSDNITNEEDIDKLFASFLNSIVNCLQKYTDFDFGKKEDVEKFYYFIKDYKDRLVNGGTPFINSVDEKIKLLFNEDPVGFFALLIKYLLKKINEKDKVIKNIVLIFDDIESQRVSVHIPFISKALNLSACLRTTNEKRTYCVKNLISLRAYTFRYHKSRQAEARRVYKEDDKESVILKASIPSMKNIFEKRFNVYYDSEEVRELIPNTERWEQSKKILMEVVENLADFGDMISSITHYDIAHSLRMFLRILTNKRWFAPNDDFFEGAFEKISKENYIPAPKERIFKALFYGEEEIFVNNRENVLPNILSVHSEEEDGIELLPLYIIEYMKTLERNNCITLYGEGRISGNDLKNNILNILNCGNSDIGIKLEKIIKRLYNQEYLLHSIFEPELDSGEELEYERNYKPEYGLYLSLRGNKVLEILENDSLLFEIFRDDIDTDLDNNTISSSKLSQTDKIIYLISYCDELFDIEKGYINDANKENYFRCFGNKFVISSLLIGIHKSIKYYYRNENEDSKCVKAKFNDLYNKIEAYKKALLDSDKTLKEADIKVPFTQL